MITGASSGIGLAAAHLLAASGASVTLACRDVGKGAVCAAGIVSAVPGADVQVVELDLASLASVRRAATELATIGSIDLLLNNAGVFSHVKRRTADGFELQLGTNHLGHFALTGLLLDQLLAVPDSRIVTISSIGERQGKIRFDDLGWDQGYRRFAAYAQSKLANLLFAFALDERLAEAGSTTRSLAAHPGGPRTGVNRGAPLWYAIPTWALGWIAGQTAERGSLPGLRAGTDRTLPGGSYIGPSGGGPLESRGLPVPVEPSARARDRELQAALWDESERLTGVRFPI